MANDSPNDEGNTRPRREAKKPEKWSYDPKEHKTMLDRKRKSLVSFIFWLHQTNVLFNLLTILEEAEESTNGQGEVQEEQGV